MDCNNVVELLSEYIDDMLNDEQKQEVERHLQSCSKCREEYETLESIVKQCHQMDEIDLPDDFHQKLLNRLIEENVGKNKYKMSRKIRRGFTAIAAVLILAVTISSAVNSGILNVGSKKQSSTAIQSESTQSDAAKNESINMSAAAEPRMQLNAKRAEEKAEMSAGSLAEEGIQGFDTAYQSNMLYKVIDINLRQDEYKKHNENIKGAVEALGGYSKQNGSLYYVIPESGMDVFMRKLRDEYGISDIHVKSIDITDEYNRLQGEITELEEKQKERKANDNKTSDNGEDLNAQIDKKRSELNDISSKVGNIFIQININN